MTFSIARWQKSTRVKPLPLYARPLNRLPAGRRSHPRQAAAARRKAAEARSRNARVRKLGQVIEHPTKERGVFIGAQRSKNGIWHPMGCRCEGCK